MTGAEVVALAGVVLGGTATIATPFVAGLADRRKLEASREVENLEDLRTVIDEAAIALTSAQRATIAASNAVWDVFGNDGTPEGPVLDAKVPIAIDAIAVAWDAKAHAAELEDRLAVRVRGTQLFFTYWESLGCITRFVDECRSIVANEWSRSELEASESLWNSVDKAEELKAAKMGFQQAASAWIGPDPKSVEDKPKFWERIQRG